MYRLTDEQRMLQAVVRELAQEKIAPRAAEIDDKAEYPWDIKELLVRQDLLALPFPEKYGGTGSDLVTFYLVVEEIARVCASSSLIVAVQALGSFPILIAGTETQKQRYFPNLASGDWLAAFALTEPGAGSDAAAMKTRAVLDGDHYILNGSKCFITNAGIAQVYSVFAMTDPSKGVKGISAFIVDADSPGFRLGKIEHKMGIRGSQTGELVFDNCIVPAGNLLGNEGDGFKIAMMTLDKSRPGVGAQAVGIAQGALDYAARYAKERIQFGAPIASLQAIQFMLADMAMQVEAARCLVYEAAARVDAGEKGITMSSAMAKCFAGDVAMRVTTDALQVLGGWGNFEIRISQFEI